MVCVCVCVREGVSFQKEKNDGILFKKKKNEAIKPFSLSGPEVHSKCGKSLTSTLLVLYSDPLLVLHCHKLEKHTKKDMQNQRVIL